MWSALGGTFGLAMGLALSPLAITTALILLLGERRGRLRALAFAIGWFVAMIAITLIPMLLIDTAHDDDPDATATGLDVMHLAFAGLFFALAGVTWLKRPAHERKPADAARAPQPAGDAGVLELEVLDLEPPEKKGFLSRLDGMGVWACLGLGLAQGVLIIKNPPLGISAGGMLGAADLPQAEQILSVVIFAVLASLGALLPLAVSIAGGPKVDHALHDARHWIEDHMTAITLVVLLVVGVIFLGEGLGIAD